MVTYLNWTCIECGHVNVISVSQKIKILKKLDPKYKGATEVIQCDKCRTQVSVEARSANDTRRP